MLIADYEQIVRGIYGADLKKCCPGAVIKKGLAIQGSSVGRCDDALKKWLERM